MFVDLGHVEHFVAAELAQPLYAQLPDVRFLYANEFAQQGTRFGLQLQREVGLLVHQDSETFKQDTLLDVVFVYTFVDTCVSEDLIQKFIDFYDNCVVRLRVDE